MKKAFTLIELLIVISIIGILTGLATISYNSIQLRSRDAQRKNDLQQLKLALSSYYTGQTPNQYVAATTKDTVANILNTPLVTGGYIKTLPSDPLGTGNYIYKYQSFVTNGKQKDFKLYGTLENQNDKKGWGGGNAWVVDGFIVQND